MDVDMEIVAMIILLVLGCQFPGLFIDVMKMDPADEDYREKRYTLGATFGAILFFLALILN